MTNMENDSFYINAGEEPAEHKMAMLDYEGNWKEFTTMSIAAGLVVAGAYIAVKKLRGLAV